jgi:hypothetical protein
MSDNISMSNLLVNTLNNTFRSGKNNSPLYYIHKQLFRTDRPQANSTEVWFSHPDISGYTYIFMQPPHLSGYGLGPDYNGRLGSHAKFLVFAGIDFTPPISQLVASELPTRTGALPFSTEYSSTGQINASYFDNADNDVFAYHKLWINYIHDILRGIRMDNSQEIKPHPDYYTPGSDKFGQIDYATSMWVMRTKPTYRLGITDITNDSDINYIGKATGVFPIIIPDKEIIGRRDANELTILPYTYTCCLYTQTTLAGAVNNKINDVNRYLLLDFVNNVLNAY